MLSLSKQITDHLCRFLVLKETCSSPKQHACKDNAFFLSVYDYEISYKCTKTRIVYRDYLYQTVNRTMRLIGHILNELHVGHIGVAKMKALTSEERGMVWWPGIDTKIKKLTKSCPGCQEFKRSPA